MKCRQELGQDKRKKKRGERKENDKTVGGKRGR